MSYPRIEAMTDQIPEDPVSKREPPQQERFMLFLGKIVSEPHTAEGSFALTLVTEPVKQAETTATVLNMADPSDIPYELGNGVAIISQRSIEEVVRSALRLHQVLPEALIGIKFYDPLEDKNEPNKLYSRAEATVGVAFHHKGQVAVNARRGTDFTVFTPDEMKQIIRTYR